MWEGHVKEGGDNAHKTEFGRPKGKRPLGRPRHEWQDNIKMDVLK